MFKYGHMLNNGDRFDYAVKDTAGQITSLTPVCVLDKWKARATRDGFWIELWTFGDNTIARPVAVKLIDAHDRITVYDPDNEPQLLMGVSPARTYSRF